MSHCKSFVSLVGQVWKLRAVAYAQLLMIPPRIFDRCGTCADDTVSTVPFTPPRSASIQDFSMLGQRGMSCKPTMYYFYWVYQECYAFQTLEGTVMLAVLPAASNVICRFSLLLGEV